MWVKLDDRMPDHPKFKAAGKYLGRFGATRAFAIYTEAICYANRNLTNGFIDTDVVRRELHHDPKPLAVAAVLARPEVRLWEPRDGGYIIHDYLQYQPSAEIVKVRRTQNRENAKRSGRPHSLKEAN